MTQSVFPKVCPRCKGSMIPERDWYGEFATCFVCGYVYEPTLYDTRQEVDQVEQDKEDGKRERGRRPSHGQGDRLIKL